MPPENPNPQPADAAVPTSASPVPGAPPVPPGSQQQLPHVHAAESLYVNGQLTREGMARVIRAGGSVVVNESVEHDPKTQTTTIRNTRHITRLEDLPDAASLARTDAERQQVRQNLEAERQRLQSQLDALDAAQTATAATEVPAATQPAASGKPANGAKK